MLLALVCSSAFADGAIVVYSNENARWSSSIFRNYPDANSVIGEALKFCHQRSNSENCRVHMLFKDQCAAVAVSFSPSSFAFGIAAKQLEAEEIADRGCRIYAPGFCAVVASSCDSTPTPLFQFVDRGLFSIVTYISQHAVIAMVIPTVLLLIALACCFWLIRRLRRRVATAAPIDDDPSPSPEPRRHPMREPPKDFQI
jgi:hypothetical protein